MENENRISNTDRNALRLIKVWHVGASGQRAFGSPALKNYAAEKDVDLNLVSGKGKNGRICKADIDRYLERQKYFEQLQNKYKAMREKEDNEKSRAFKAENIFGSSIKIESEREKEDLTEIIETTSGQTTPEISFENASATEFSLEKVPEKEPAAEDAVEEVAWKAASPEEAAEEASADWTVFKTKEKTEHDEPLFEMTSAADADAVKITETVRKNQPHVNPPRYRHAAENENQTAAASQSKKDRNDEDPWSTIRRLIVP